MWWLLAALAMGQEPGTSPTEDPCAAGLQTAIEAVRVSGSKPAYLCLAERDDAEVALLENLRQGGPNQERATRALAVHLMQRLDRALTGEEVRALNPSDRRLLRDAVYARRGRASPAAEHVAVFQQFDWYKPDPKFTDGRLDDIDRANLGIIDHPPPEPPPEPAAAAMADVPPPPAPAPDLMAGRCGCATGEGSHGLLAALILGFNSLRAARRRSAGTGTGAPPRAG